MLVIEWGSSKYFSKDINFIFYWLFNFDELECRIFYKILVYDIYMNKEVIFFLRLNKSKF